MTNQKHSLFKGKSIILWSPSWLRKLTLTSKDFPEKTLRMRIWWRENLWSWQNQGIHSRIRRISFFLPLKEWINTLDQKFREAIQWSSYENFLQNVQWELKNEKRDFPERKGMNIIQFANHHILFRLRWVVTNLKSSWPRQNYRITMYFDISFIYSNIFWREFPWIRIKISLNWQHILEKQSLKHWWMKPPFWIGVFQNLYEEYSGIFSHFLTKVSWSTREHTERSSRRSSRVSCIRVKIHELILREEKFITEFIQGIHSESQKRHFWRIEWKKILTWESSWINSFSSLCAIRGPQRNTWGFFREFKYCCPRSACFFILLKKYVDKLFKKVTIVMRKLKNSKILSPELEKL